MAMVKNFFRSALQVAPFILANTIIFIPYFLFLSLNKGVELEAVLPFVLFYTFRMTGIFLLKSFRLSMSIFNILIIAILLGGAGSLIGIMGQFYFPLYLVSAILMGVSASWLPAANTTVNYHEKQQGTAYSIKNKYFFILLILGGLLASLALGNEWRIPVVFAEYTLLYAAAYHTVTHYADYVIDFNEVDQQTISVKELFLFFIFFILLLLIRSARLLFEPDLLTVAIIGFSIVFVLAAWLLNRQRKNWQLPLWLNLMTFGNGMCMNFIFLFGTFYVALRFGAEHLVVRLYIPYMLGIIAAAFFTKFFYRLFSKVAPKVIHAGAFIVSLTLLLFQPLFSIGVFFLSCSISAASSFLNRLYYQETVLPKESRIITKYSTQTKGSITHQLLLMSGLWLMVKEEHLPVQVVLQITAHRTANPAAIRLVEMIHLLSVSILLLFFCLVFSKSWKES
ncbi:hypothetical protein GIX45_17175 [Erwinia sp. CPCC 100877]|nr:hypothetical protein [Erwinia sp. CPCC 100877]